MVERSAAASGADPHLLSLCRVPVPLQGETRVALRLAQWYRHTKVVNRREEWQARTAGYLYAFDDADKREIAAYHWHPDQRSHFILPHLHLDPGAGALRRDLTRAHFPTGRVRIDEVVRFAIEALGVRPIRTDWDDVLRRVGAELTE